MSKLLILPATLESLRSLQDKSVKLTVHTQELTPDQAGQLMGAMQTYGYMAWKAEGFHENEQLLLDQLKADKLDGRKTQSQRLRGVLYRLWEHDGQGMTDLQFYEFHMDQIINHYKSKLP
jgi:hypothetical protein